MDKPTHDIEGAIAHLKENGHDHPVLEALTSEAAVESMRAVNHDDGIQHRPKPAGDPGVRRDGDGVLVYGKDRVMEVYQNAEGNYSVTGYARRSRRCFGDFFLGMDAGPEYDRQSSAINKAIGAISAEEGFALAMEVVTGLLPGLKGDPVDAQKVTDAMLAGICKPLFGLPDEHFIISGGISFHLFPPGRCPGDYAPLSGYLFLPDPGVALTLGGVAFGHILKEQTDKYVAGVRKKGGEAPGQLAKVLFETIPEAEDDLLSRTLIGIMMGLLPTIEGNMVKVLEGLHASGAYFDLMHKIGQLPAPATFPAALAILQDPMFMAMQEDPMPPAVWRTAVKDHELGGVPVKAGEKVTVAIKSATQEDLKAGRIGVSAVFGGDRSADPHPLHACPGYELSIGLMIGTLTALMLAGR